MKFIFIVLLYALVSCKGNSNNNQFKFIIVTLEKSNRSIDNELNGIYAGIDADLEDPQTRMGAAIWQPRANRIRQTSDSLLLYIDQLKQVLERAAGVKIIDSVEHADLNNEKAVRNIFYNDNRGSELYKRLVIYNEAIIGAFRIEEFKDLSKWYEQFVQDLHQLKDEMTIDIKNEGELQWVDEHFKYISVAGALAMLAKIEQDLLITELSMIRFIRVQESSYTDSYDAIQPLIRLNSSYLKKGQPLEITAGIGSFISYIKPIVVIDGQKVILNNDKIAFYTKKTDMSPGKYQIPVTIEYYKPDGSKATFNRKVEYEIAP
ncbi:MAG: hypothetical protein QM731_07880 [Chitinophagaceae bacterium]